MKKKILITIENDEEEPLEVMENFLRSMANGYNKECPPGSKMTVEIV